MGMDQFRSLFYCQAHLLCNRWREILAKSEKARDHAGFDRLLVEAQEENVKICVSVYHKR